MSEPPLSDHRRDVSAERDRRLSFGAVAEQYDRHRPAYPAEMVADVLTYAGAGPGDRALDVGAGTGRATLQFGERGLRMTAVEPDAGMAAVASQRAAAAGLTVEFVGLDFEASFDVGRLPEHAFRLLVSGTAWHWITPELRNRLAARALAPGGTLAPFWNRPVWQDNPLRPAFEAAYAQLEQDHEVRPGGVMSPFGSPPQIRDDREWLEREFRGNPQFTDVDARQYRWQQRYTTSEYLALLGTHSDHIVLPAQAREQLFSRITEAIEGNGGSFEFTYQTLLCLARRNGARAGS